MKISGLFSKFNVEMCMSVHLGLVEENPSSLCSIIVDYVYLGLVAPGDKSLWGLQPPKWRKSSVALPLGAAELLKR